MVHSDFQFMRPGRKLLWLSAAITFGALATYVVQVFVVQHLTVPWYLAVLGGVGFTAALASFFQSPTFRRGLIAAPIALVAAASVWFVITGSLLPTYQGPLNAGTDFPPFTAKRTDGGQFSESDFRGQPTVLAFFRGRW